MYNIQHTIVHVHVHVYNMYTCTCTHMYMCITLHYIVTCIIICYTVCHLMYIHVYTLYINYNELN